jgi:phytanoyl-CoA hydroxylase
MSAYVPCRHFVLSPSRKPARPLDIDIVIGHARLIKNFHGAPRIPTPVRAVNFYSFHFVLTLLNWIRAYNSEDEPVCVRVAVLFGPFEGRKNVDQRRDSLMAKITTEQLAQYEREGFLTIEGFADLKACDALRARAEELVAAFDPDGERSIFSTHEQTRTSDNYFLNSGDRVSFFFEEEAFNAEGRLRQSKEHSINKIGHALHDLDAVFNRFSRTKELAALASLLGFTRPLLIQSMYVFKQPNIGGEVTCHQDATFLYTEPLSVVGLWFALEDACEENGCLWAIPGGHLRGLKSRFIRAPNGGTSFETFDENPWPIDQLVPLEVRKGTLIVLHGLLPHMSLTNRSPRSRHAYTLHIIESNCHYPADNWLQRAPRMPLRGFDKSSDE